MFFKTSVVVIVNDWARIDYFRDCSRNFQDFVVFIGNGGAQCLWNLGRGSRTEIIVELVFRSE